MDYLGPRHLRDRYGVVDLLLTDHDVDRALQPYHSGDAFQAGRTSQSLEQIVGQDRRRVQRNQALLDGYGPRRELLLRDDGLSRASHQCGVEGALVARRARPDRWTELSSTQDQDRT